MSGLRSSPSTPAGLADGLTRKESRYAGAAAGDSPQWPRPQLGSPLPLIEEFGSIEPGTAADAYIGTQRASRRENRRVPLQEILQRAPLRREPELALIAVRAADLPENREHLRGGGRARLAFAGHRPDPADWPRPSDVAKLDAWMTARQLRQNRYSEPRRDEALDHLVVLALERDLRLVPGVTAELQHLHPARARECAAEPLLVGEILDPHRLRRRERMTGR